MRMWGVCSVGEEACGGTLLDFLLGAHFMCQLTIWGCRWALTTLAGHLIAVLFLGELAEGRLVNATIQAKKHQVQVGFGRQARDIEGLQLSRTRAPQSQGRALQCPVESDFHKCNGDTKSESLVCPMSRWTHKPGLHHRTSITAFPTLIRCMICRYFLPFSGLSFTVLIVFWYTTVFKFNEIQFVKNLFSVHLVSYPRNWQIQCC